MTEHAHRKSIYHWQEDVEYLERYNFGGYHPVQLSDRYSDGRYQIVHKLGFGSYSTVWLGLDLSSNSYVAVKVLVAAASKKSTESRILQHLRDQCDKQDERMRLLPILLDEFWIDGPNGQHRCLVTEPAGCDVATSKEDHPFTLPLMIARAVAAQAVIGIASIHRKGIIHGDLYPRNMLFALPPTNGLSVDDIYEKYHMPRETPVERVDGRPLGPEAPPYTVMPALLYVDPTKIDDPAIRITDFGEAWLSTDTQPKSQLNTPTLYLPPETTFAKSSISFAADIWTLACSVFEILGDGTLFEGFFADRDYVIAENVSCLGPLPEDWWDLWKAGKEFFVENGVWQPPCEMKRPHDSKSRPLAMRIQQMGREADPEFSAAEAECLEKMLRSMLRWEPAERATAEDVMTSEWMLKWGFPALKAYNIPT
ncbi:MAG: hypothetical protein Q9170_001510 [Blastenia crenularia]